MGVDSQRVFINNYADAQSSLKALQKNSGVELWEAHLVKGYYTQAEDGSLFWVSGSEVNSIAPDSGKILWTFRAQPDDSLWLTFENQGLYVREKTRMSLLDKKSGHVMWSYDYGPFADQYPFTQVLKSGVVLIRVDDYAGLNSRHIALNSSTGKVIWERAEANAISSISEGNMSGTWIISGKTIKALNPWTGAIRWTYSLESEELSKHIMTVLEQDDSTVYVSYGSAGSKFPPMGVLALDMKTGHLKWKNWVESSISRIGSNSRTLILNKAQYGSTKALRK
jgi:outer membrane protein assembly factor BamB